MERWSILFLIVLLCIFLVSLWIIRSNQPPSFVEVAYHHEKETKEDPSTDNNQNITYADTTILTENKSTLKLDLFYPDSLSTAGWKGIGFSEKQSAAIVKYKRSIGGFKNREQVEKCFVISSTKFQEISPFMQFASPPTPVAKKDINDAIAEDLRLVYGIGDVLSKRIIKFRNKIGGFHSNHQLDRVYGLPDSTRILVGQKFTFSQEKIQTININTASKKELEKYPYLNFSSIAMILKQRQKEPLINLDFLDQAYIDEKDKKMILPYITY